MTSTVIERAQQLTDAHLTQIRQVAAQAAETDGVAALNEASELALERLAKGGDVEARVWLARQGDAVVGVLVDANGDASGADLVVAPDVRRQGVGSQLLSAYMAESNSEAALWAHGDLPEAAELAREHGFEPVRTLWKMSRPIAADDSFAAELPQGFAAEPFDGSAEQATAWLEVNALAFAYHPEQGRMRMEDFDERTQEDWFDPKGLILVWDTTTKTPTLAASHWVKFEKTSGVGEVYVVAVSPSYQGRGLAKPLTNLGLARLQEVGATTVELYVEGDNEPAKATYARVGFTRTAHDAMYRLAPNGKTATKHD